jgi:hypothetical protein
MELVRPEPRVSLCSQWDLIGLSFLEHLMNGAGGGKHAVLISMGAGRLVLARRRHEREKGKAHERRWTDRYRISCRYRGLASQA